MQIIWFANGGRCAPPTPPPLLRPSMPASVIVLNHLRTLHDFGTPGFFVRPSKLAAVIRIILFAPPPQPPPSMPSMLRVLMVFIIYHHFSTSGFILVIVFILLFHHVHPFPFSSFSFLMFSLSVIIFMTFLHHFLSVPLLFIKFHHLSSLFVSCHHFL